MRKKRQQERRPIPPSSWSDAATRVVEELGDESAADQLRFECAQNAIRVEAQSDRLLMTVFLTMIVGGVALLFTVSFDLWVGSPIFLALACFALGLSQTILHARGLRRLAEHADAVTMDDESAAEHFEELRRGADSDAGFQLFLLTLGALLAAGGLIAHFWNYAWRAALIALGLKAFFLTVSALSFFIGKLRK
ncbi:MAG TPA: hypothetical protein VF278_07065 [Pirellulales bacterium]